LAIKLGVLVAAILAVFGRVVSFDFVRWDDDINITQNPLLAAPWSWELLARLFESDQAMRFKPLHWLLDLAVHRLFGFDPRAWHALNLVLHALAAGLFFVVLRRIFQRQGGVPAAGGAGRVGDGVDVSVHGGVVARVVRVLCGGRRLRSRPALARRELAGRSGGVCELSGRIELCLLSRGGRRVAARGASA
jgi:hypothetical protein